jgi:hypothetical protein
MVLGGAVIAVITRDVRPIVECYTGSRTITKVKHTQVRQCLDG